MPEIIQLVNCKKNKKIKKNCGKVASAGVLAIRGGVGGVYFPVCVYYFAKYSRCCYTITVLRSSHCVTPTATHIATATQLQRKQRKQRLHRERSAVTQCIEHTAAAH